MDDKDIALANSKVQYRTLLREDGCTVLQTTIQAGGETQWHHHTHVSDQFLVVRGVLTVERNIDGRVESTRVHDFYSVDPGVVHHVKNETDEALVYIMVQAGGVPDIVLAEPSP
ncbi:cupin domain-containing protein [Paraburkholderia hospita]|jgi:quercetin dioxygenase-like cupin family protein|uniref:Cupin 2 conserved barrel domain protein n=1 Tax=Paraburkholderia hospita TaxID=169430 RepID=A0AAJ4X5K7_9BURK|nr:cupin domain-containing protein [Paraburkholderia hospita]EUC20038.1 Cupin 2 conserved barrel domain protein [Burkholderia sp. BT03]SKC97697.1 Cupin domain-containing protein [Burkholderia sp. CF099]SOE83190.1 Cupin domain-containing protein [Burkholderia sp. YR290]AUT73451.1 cupin domain-containing protein [Paraburkholderia hospita]AXF05106.1 cupin domain-containing protein [Paraburkholderia hospita]